MSQSSYPFVVFDFDGTLADTFPWFAGVLGDVAARYRFGPIVEEDVDVLRGLDARAIVRHLRIPAWKLPFITRHMHALATRDIASLRLFAGVPAMLADLHDGGIRLGIVSSNTEANIRAVLGPREAGRIAHYACGASLFGKARRLRGLVRASGFAAAETLYIGDEIRDAEAAREAGCAFGAVAWGYTRREALARHDPALSFDDPGAIVGALMSAANVTGPPHRH